MILGLCCFTALLLLGVARWDTFKRCLCGSYLSQNFAREKTMELPRLTNSLGGRAEFEYASCPGPSGNAEWFAVRAEVIAVAHSPQYAHVERSYGIEFVERDRKPVGIYDPRWDYWSEVPLGHCRIKIRGRRSDHKPQFRTYIHSGILPLFCRNTVTTCWLPHCSNFTIAPSGRPGTIRARCVALNMLKDWRLLVSEATYNI